MTVDDAARDFLLDLKINVNELAERDALRLWAECEYVEEPIADRFDEITLSVWNRIQHATYFKALDTFLEALKLTLLGPEEEDEEDEDEEDEDLEISSPPPRERR